MKIIEIMKIMIETLGNLNGGNEWWLELILEHLVRNAPISYMGGGLMTPIHLELRWTQFRNLCFESLMAE